MFKTILQVHNLYQQPGGEERVFSIEKDLLEAHGHRVVAFTVHNDSLKNAGAISKAKTALNSVWNRKIYGELRSLLRAEKPTIVHFHNTFPLVSPAAYHACHAEGVPVVQTLHNYRLMCANGLFFRESITCEACMGKTIPWPALRNKCYRGGLLPTATVGAVNAVHKGLKTWTRKVDAYIALTEFAKEKFIAGGLPREKIHIKPNFLSDSSPVASEGGDDFLFVGRLSEEKGVRTLLKAWEKLGPDFRLKIAGDGPLAPLVAEACLHDSRMQWLGRQTTPAILKLMRDARALVFPSVWYEGFPVTIVEAMSVGLPVIASNLGAMSTLIEPGVTGLHAAPGDAADLARTIGWAASHPKILRDMRETCRGTFTEKYAPDHNYALLMKIYENAARTFSSVAS